jgi:hypothetical protein
MHTHEHTCTHTHAHSHAHTHMHTYAHACTRMHMHAHVCTHMHTHAHTCTHLHTCTCKYSSATSPSCLCVGNPLISKSSGFCSSPSALINPDRNVKEEMSVAVRNQCCQSIMEPDSATSFGNIPSPFTTHKPLLTAHCSALNTHHPTPTTHYSQPATHDPLLLIAHYIRRPAAPVWAIC